MPHIGAQKFGLSSEVAQFRDELLTFIVVPAGNYDPCSITREGQAVARPMPVSAPVIKTTGELMS